MRIGYFCRVVMALAVAAEGGLVATIHAQEASQRQPAGQGVQTFALETYAQRGLNYCNRMVDKDGLPYFDIFWTEPPRSGA